MAGETELERMVIRLMGDSSHYQKMLGQAQKTTKEFSKKIKEFGQEMTKWVSLPIAIIGGLAVNEFAKFDQAMTETFAKMGRVAPEVRRELEGVAKALSMSGQVAFSPAELATGYEELASAGLDAAQAMKTLPLVAKFAQAGAFDLSVAVKQLVGSMASFGFALNNMTDMEVAREMERFSDVIVGVANETTTGVEEVARAMAADAAVAAKGYGMTLEELGAVLGVYALQNKDAEEAGNLTGRAIRLMTASFVKNKQAWLDMGINLTDARGNFIKFSDAIALLERSFEGLSAEQRIITLGMLGFETLSQKSILPLIGQSKELKRQELIYKKLGITSTMAEIQMESFGNNMKVLRNHLQSVGIEIGAVLVPFLRKLAIHVQNLLQWWRGLDESTRSTIVGVAALAAAVGPLLVALGVIVPLFVKLTAAVLSVKVGMLGLGAVLAAAKFAMVIVFLEKLVKFYRHLVAEAANAYRSVRKLNEELKKGKQLDEQIQSRFKKQTEGILAVSSAIKDRTEKEKFLIAQLQQAKQELQGYANHIALSRREIERYSSVWNEMGQAVGAGGGQLDIAEQGLRASEEAAKDATDRISQLQAALDELATPAADGQAVEDQLAEMEQALQDAEAKSQSLEDSFTTTKESLEQEIATFGATSREVEIYALQMKGAAKEQVDFLKSLVDTITNMEGAEQVAQDLADRGRQISEQFKSPLQEFNEQVAELNKLFQVGAITEEIFGKAMDDAKERLDQATGASNAFKESLRQMDTALAGGAEAQSRIEDFRNAIAQRRQESRGNILRARALPGQLVLDANAPQNERDKQDQMIKLLQEAANHLQAMAKKDPINVQAAGL